MYTTGLNDLNWSAWLNASHSTILLAHDPSHYWPTLPRACLSDRSTKGSYVAT